jgi:hypothetical protein
MFHWTEHNIRVHTFTCVVVLQIAHPNAPDRRPRWTAPVGAPTARPLAGIGETVLIYPSTGGRPKARRKLIETTDLQDQLAGIFQLDHWAAAVRS